MRDAKRKKMRNKEKPLPMFSLIYFNRGCFLFFVFFPVTSTFVGKMDLSRRSVRIQQVGVAMNHLILQSFVCTVSYHALPVPQAVGI